MILDKTTEGSRMQTSWESELATFLTDLSAVQGESLEILTRKTKLLAASDRQGLADLGQEEEHLIEKLQECMQRRQALLERASSEGLPAESLRSLTKALPQASRERLGPQVSQVTARSRLLQHQSLTNWVIVQRTLIHLSQLLEIIATGGQMKPTYGKGESRPTAGSLVNQVV
jgi:flagellar biosynthesis/type III secretory pathway chaperone